MCIANISGVLGDMFRFIYSRVCCRLCLKKKKPQQTATEHGAMPGQAGEITGGGDGIENQWANGKNAAANNKNGAKVVDDNFENDVKPEDDADKVTVPLTITMIIITVYILLGALLFNLFEGWTPVQAGYFCFITLATIGNYF